MQRSPNLGIIPGIAEQFSSEFSLEMFKRGCFTRAFEFKTKEAFDKGLIKIPIYLCVGQEFNSAALSMVLKNFDIFAQHRAHGLYLAFGGKPEALRDELLGLPTGCSGGMSGSNAIQSPEARLFGHSGLMGEQIPIAVGATLASHEPALAIAGDASIEEDYIYPSLGLAATRKLPLLFLCEDNGLSILTPVKTRRNWSVAPMAESLGIPSVEITDNPWLLAHHAQEMSKNLPGFITLHTVRNLWHAGTGNDGPPEWDRYKMIKETLFELGLEKEVIEIEKETSEVAAKLWQQQLQTP